MGAAGTKANGRSVLSGKALGAAVFWGLSFVASRHALTWLSPVGLVATRMLIGAAMLALIALLAGRPVRLRPVDRPRVLLLGGILAAHLLLQNNGLLKTTATNTGWLIGFIPICLALAAYFLHGERIPARGWGGIVLGALGIALVSLAGGLRLDPAKLGDLLQLASCLTWTAYTLLAVEPIRHNGAQPVTQWTIGLAGLATLVAAGFAPVLRGPASGGAVVAVLFLGFVCSGLAYWMWYAAVAEIGSTRTGVYLYLEPFVTSVAAWLVLGERVTVLTIAGGLTVLAGVWIVNAARRPATA